MTRSLSRPVLGVVVAVLLLLLLVPAAAAAPKRITGKLNKGGYTVIAVAANGKAKAVRAAKGGRFGLRPPATRVTLHLRAPNGRYGGPIVVGRKKKGKVAILGVRAGAKLGRIKVSARAGYARVAKKLRKKRWADTTRRARARKGVPIGAAVFGRVRSRGVRTVVPGDQDLDGIPGPLDIDDDGDLVLDGLDRVTGPRVAQTPMGEFQITSLLAIPLYDTANANAAGSTDQQVETALRDWGRLNYVILPGDSAELDCQGLIYCSPGGTGRIWAGMTYASATPFPVPCCDADGDGFGTLKAPGSVPGMTLYHGATTGQSGSGDLLIQRVTTGGVETQFPATLPFLFATVPALVSYDDEAGNARTISYPVLGPGDPGGPGPGTHGNELPITDGPDADPDVELTMTFWRPQRRPIPPETGTWIDIGALRYTTSIFAHPPGGVAAAAVGCPQGAFTEADPQVGLAPPSPSTPNGGVVDLVGDRPASPANTFTYTLNVTQCLASSGLSFDSGSRLDLTSLAATNSNGAAEQGLSFKRP